VSWYDDDCDCPSPSEARRAGERDYEYNGYRTYTPKYECDEANSAYRLGQASAEMQAEEESAARAAAENREYERQAAESAYYDWMQQAEYERYMQAQFEQDHQPPEPTP
jgi:hypothetical protein